VLRILRAAHRREPVARVGRTLTPDRTP